MAHDATTYQLETETGVVVAGHITVADTLGRRTMGLMFKPGLEPGHGIVIRPCGSIHMFFMRFPIDVAFVDRDGRVVHICDSIRPWRISRIVRRSRAAIELEAGALRRAGVETGALLRLVETKPA